MACFHSNAVCCGPQKAAQERKEQDMIEQMILISQRDAQKKKDDHVVKLKSLVTAGAILGSGEFTSVSEHAALTSLGVLISTRYCVPACCCGGSFF